MRLAIDVQACQWGGARAARALAVAHGLRAAAHGHDVTWVMRTGVAADAAWLREVLDGDALVVRGFQAPLPTAAAQPDNAWRARAAGLAWSSFLAGLNVDAVIVVDAAVGFSDDGVFAVPDPVGPPVVAIVGSVPARGVGADRQRWYAEWQQALTRVAAVIAPAGFAPPGPPLSVAPAGAAELAATALAAAQDAVRQRALRPDASAHPGTALAAHAQSPGGRPRLAYVSPVPPAASGIADYSAELLPALAEHYRIEVICPDEPAPDAAIVSAFPVRSPAWLRENAAGFDRILYHVGNSPFHTHMLALLREHPGVVVLHDFYLGHVFGNAQHTGRLPMALWRALLRSHGHAALRLYRAQGEAAALAAYPCNLEIFAQADGVILHSRHAEALARRWAGPTPPCPVHVVPLSHATPGEVAERAAARARLGLADDAFVACSFGYAGQTKMSRELVEGWIAARLPGAHLALVGGHQFEGDYSRALEARMREARPDADIRLTGYAPLSVYRDYLAAADVAIQLRTQSRGETSRAILDAMSHGVAVLANAHGSAAELPADCAVLLPEMPSVADIAHVLTTLAADPGRRQGLAAAAGRHVRTRHDPVSVARQYRDAIEDAARRGPRTAAGLARGAMAAMAAWRDPLALPTRAQAARFARQLLANLPQPQSRGVPPDTAAVTLHPGRLSPQGLRVLSLSPARPRDARLPRDWRRRTLPQVMADAGITWDVVEWAVGPAPGDGDGPDTVRVAALSSDSVPTGAPDARTPALASAEPPHRLADALAVLAGVQEATGLAALAGRLRAVGYDAIHLDTPFGLPLLRAAWAQVPGNAPLPALLYDAPCCETDGAARLLASAPAAAIAQAEQDAIARAGLCLVPNESVRAALVAQGAAPWRVRVVPDGATPPAEDPARSHAVYQDHLPQRPFALWISEDDAAARQGFLDLMGRSFAFLPPDATLVVAGRLCDFIETSPAFNAWAGINRARVRLMADADELMLSGARRHAHVVLLARAALPGQSGEPDAQAAEALRDDRPVLARPAALQGLTVTRPWPALTVEADMDRFRARLVAALRAPAPAVTPAAPVPWSAALRHMPRHVADLVQGHRAVTNRGSA